MNNLKLSLSVMPNKLAICRLDKNAQTPLWTINNVFFSVTKTTDELSIVCSENNIPTNVMSEKGWRALKIEGQLDFSLTGILSSILNPLAKAKISIFAISTYNTDYILVKDEKLEKAVKILSTFCNIQR